MSGLWRTFGFLILMSFHGVQAWSQNLIKNPSFEVYDQCPQHLGTFHADVVNWTSPSLASTDYFNACSTAMGTPENFNGTQDADFGQGYAGLYMFAPNDYREYAQGELALTLQMGVVYKISFYVSLAERSDYAVREFGLVFSEKPLNRPTKKALTKMQLYKQPGNNFAFLEISHSDYYNETTDWVKLEAEFTASGIENFLTIGNFQDNARTRTHKTSRNAKKGAYYYLDMVQLIPVNSDLAATGLPSDEAVASYALDTEHLFNHVLFAFDNFHLSGEAKAELHKLYAYLKTHQNLHIAINGHTDNRGPASYNQKLSGLRCKAVSDFLVELGLAADRIRWISHGFEQPIADNGTEAGRQKNRRVAFVLSHPGTQEPQ